MEVKRKMHELKSADVRFISLVTRAANRIPFRVVKSENDMSIDLSGRYTRNIKKQEAVTPGIVGVVVFKQEDAAKMEAVEAVLKGAGFAVDAVEDNEDGTRIYKQEADIPADASVIRLSDNTALVVKGFTKQAEIMAEAAQFSEAVPAEGFFQGPVVASEAYQAEMLGMVKKGDTSGMAEVTKQYHNYMGAMTTVIPAVAFKADLEIGEVLKAEKKAPEGSKEEEAKETPAVEAAEASDEDKAKAKKEEDDAAAAAATLPNGDGVVPVVKEEVNPVEAALAGLKDSILAFKSEMSEQMKNFRAELDNVARKQDDANTQVTTTVMAVAKGDKEVPAVVQKQDDDPRTGCFDTAMMRRRK